MAGFQELSDQLGKTLADISLKRKALDEATVAVQQANTEYCAAVNYGQEIKQQMTQLMNDAIPTTSTDKIR